MALERLAGGPAKPRDRRERLRPADAREDDRRARHPNDLSLQFDHDLGRFRQKRGEALLCVVVSSLPARFFVRRPPLRSRLKVRTSDGWQHRRKLPRGTSALVPTALVCLQAAGPPGREKPSTRRDVSPVMLRKEPASPTINSWADKGRFPATGLRSKPWEASGPTLRPSSTMCAGQCHITNRSR